MIGGEREGAGRPKGTTKPDSEKRKRIPMTTIKPGNHKYLIGLKAEGYNLAKIFDQMIEDHKAKGTSR